MAWVVVAAMTVVLVVATRVHRRALEPPATAGRPRPGRTSIVAIELAGGGEAMVRLLGPIGAVGRDGVRRALRIDRWIVLGYGVGLASLAALSIGPVRDASSGALRWVGVAIALGAAALAVGAAGLDLLENRSLTAVLDRWSEPPPTGGSPEQQAAARSAHRRELVAALESPSRSARRYASWKFRSIAVVLVWMLAAATIAVTHVTR